MMAASRPHFGHSYNHADSPKADIVIAEEAGGIDSSEDSSRRLREEARFLSRAYPGRPNGDVGTLGQN